MTYLRKQPRADYRSPEEGQLHPDVKGCSASQWFCDRAPFGSQTCTVCLSGWRRRPEIGSESNSGLRVGGDD